MATLPGTRFFWRVADASADPTLETDWTEDADGILAGTAGESYQWIAFGPSTVATVVNDTTPGVTAPDDVVVNGDSAVSAEATGTGTNLVYSLINAPNWLSIDPSSGAITGTSPNENISVVVTVRVNNSLGSGSDTFSLTVNEVVPGLYPSANAITGGTQESVIDGDATWRVITITSTTNLTVNENVSADFVAVGGGGGSGWLDTRAGGGGAGEVQKFVTGETNNTVGAQLSLLVSASPITVTVGAGGATSEAGNIAGSNGSSTSIEALVTAIGGGGGASPGAPAIDGGSGGGTSSDNTFNTSGKGLAIGTGLGNDGGGVPAGSTDYNAGAGGGGAGGAGQDIQGSSTGGIGGAGYVTSITGTSLTLARGGHGARSALTPTAGAANTGNGGGGQNPGGSGIVILRYRIA